MTYCVKVAHILNLLRGELMYKYTVKEEEFSSTIQSSSGWFQDEIDVGQINWRE